MAICGAHLIRWPSKKCIAWVCPKMEEEPLIASTCIGRGNQKKFTDRDRIRTCAAETKRCLSTNRLVLLVAPLLAVSLMCRVVDPVALP